MNDPWDVKSVRQPGQYTSCMRINGVPILPPVLSRECRKEMQYYKLLALEVEKRISLLKPYVLESDSELSEDKTDAPELPEYEHNTLSQTNEELTSYNEKNTLETPLSPTADYYNSITSTVTVLETNHTDKDTSLPKYIIDLSLNINDINNHIDLNSSKDTSLQNSPIIDLPERDYNCNINNKFEKELLTEHDTVKHYKKKEEVVEEKEKYNASISNEPLLDKILDFPLKQDGPSSLSSKSFTGSLNDLYTESLKEQVAPALIRQSSYTLLEPSPQLLAHLEVESYNTGVEMNCISMSESLSNLSSPSRKRRSWDLETAKVKWSSMALELKQKSSSKPASVTSKTHIARSTSRKMLQTTPSRARSVMSDKPRRGSLPAKTMPKSEPIQKTKKTNSPVRNVPNKRAVPKELLTPTSQINTVNPTPQVTSPKPKTNLISESDDPATRVRELYEKIQKQQLIQMANLVEKQKKEQMLLQQVFEEQNNLLYNQLKSICPKTNGQAREAWSDKYEEADRGPVSLSQLINHKSPNISLCESSLSSTLTDTNNYINHCDNVLKKSRDISGSIKKTLPKSQTQNGNKNQSCSSKREGSRTRTNSPTSKVLSASRKLNYDTSASSDREYEPILTDRTNDTMADLNVTFTSDNSDEYSYKNPIASQYYSNETSVRSNPLQPNAGATLRSTDSAIKSMEKTIYNSMNTMSTRASKPIAIRSQPTTKERTAATKIVAHAKGFMVRRLMKTERVQGIVQTIKDALLCALQLHQDREGIRGADVDLHRRLIQQITAACYSLHDTFVASSPTERCALIAADRARKRALAFKMSPKPYRQTDVMTQSHSGAFPSRAKRAPSSLMTQSTYGNTGRM